MTDIDSRADGPDFFSETHFFGPLRPRIDRYSSNRAWINLLTQPIEHPRESRPQSEHETDTASCPRSVDFHPMALHESSDSPEAGGALESQVSFLRKMKTYMPQKVSGWSASKASH
jgi:hypothetical protein